MRATLASSSAILFHPWLGEASFGEIPPGHLLSELLLSGYQRAKDRRRWHLSGCISSDRLDWYGVSKAARLYALSLAAATRKGAPPPT